MKPAALLCLALYACVWTSSAGDTVRFVPDAARDSSDRGAIALLNEHGYRVLVKLADEARK